MLTYKYEARDPATGKKLQVPYKQIAKSRLRNL
jgi:hypothetical protein